MENFEEEEGYYGGADENEELPDEEDEEEEEEVDEVIQEVDEDEVDEEEEVDEVIQEVDEDEVDEEEEDENQDTSGDEGEIDLIGEYQEQSVDENSEDEDYSSSDEEIENKVNNEFKAQFMKNIHPEEFHDNYNYIKLMTNVTRDDLNLVKDQNHVTLPILTKYEKARVLGLRISQLNKGAKPYIENKNHHIVDMHIIAETELKEKRLPFIIMRPFPNGKKEYWKLEDLEIIEN